MIPWIFFLKKIDCFFGKISFLETHGMFPCLFFNESMVGHVSLKPRFLEEAHKRLGDLVILIVEGWKPYREQRGPGRLPETSCGPFILDRCFFWWVKIWVKISGQQIFFHIFSIPTKHQCFFLGVNNFQSQPAI